MRNVERYAGIKVRGHNVNNLRYADATVLITENKEDLQRMLDIAKEERSKKEMELNSKNTEVMAVSRNNECSRINTFINENKLKQRDQFKYLGS